MNPGGTLERAHASLTELLEKDRVQRAHKAEVPTEEATPKLANDKVMLGLQVANEFDAVITRTAAGLPTLTGDAFQEADEPTEAAYARSATTASTSVFGFADAPKDRRFQASQPTDAIPPGAISADLFYQTSCDTALQTMIE